jgi:phosphate starvation-inducible membrane PsiE
MSGEDDVVTSPDQRRPGNARLDRIGAVVTAALLIVLLLADHPNDTEVVWVCGSSAVLLIAVAADWLLRRNGLRS